EAVQLVKVLQNLDPPICIDGHTVLVNLATGRRRNDYGEQGAKPYYSGKRGVRDRRGAERHSEPRSGPGPKPSPSDVSTFIYDPDTGNYYDPIAGLYYDPRTQKEVPAGREAASSPTNGRGRRHGSQERTSERKEPSSRDRKERGRSTAAKVSGAVARRGPRVGVSPRPLQALVSRAAMPKTPGHCQLPPNSAVCQRGSATDHPPPPPRPPAPREEQPRRAASEQDKLTDWTKLACLLCRRQFPNKEVLLKHQQLSNLHKQNLEIHRKIKRSEQELAYLEKREREGKGQEKGNGRRERFQRLDSPERKRPKEAWDSESDQSPAGKARIESNKGSRTLQAVGWKEGSGLGRQQQGMTSPVEAEGQKKGAGLGNQGKPSKRQSNETYRDAVRRVMFARYKELE
uniref:G-patch domain-containing protein n=1 Tax=Pelodiscus sinensis TaxID=13735 RepID=K7GBT8_PELSI